MALVVLLLVDVVALSDPINRLIDVDVELLGHCVRTDREGEGEQ